MATALGLRTASQPSASRTSPTCSSAALGPGGGDSLRAGAAFTGPSTSASWRGFRAGGPRDRPSGRTSCTDTRSSPSSGRTLSPTSPLGHADGPRLLLASGSQPRRWPHLIVVNPHGHSRRPTGGGASAGTLGSGSTACTSSRCAFCWAPGRTASACSDRSRPCPGLDPPQLQPAHGATTPPPASRPHVTPARRRAWGPYTDSAGPSGSHLGHGRPRPGARAGRRRRIRRRNLASPTSRSAA